jgi:hypothetical protein
LNLKAKYNKEDKNMLQKILKKREDLANEIEALENEIEEKEEILKKKEDKLSFYDELLEEEATEEVADDSCKEDNGAVGVSRISYAPID